ncbi:fatty acyl-AMP ligase [Mycolicibacterium sp. 050158]|uniref:fatty acyl-AMP ligase n=1 Tax=Mycolicibacterium sp. 050158 TaxID=3090602 RepID=UPI00299DA475|nr:fatty acyl-AMP ligase [Mycolicibacterium sp. 050158]MDX1889741.1 fatty acyl-AMP ligase [Mycolicibacterium sp. 050158]
MPTLVDLLRRRAEVYRDKVAFSFSYDGDDENRTQLTYRELDVKARAIAATLRRQGAAGERVLVLCRPGLDHIAGYFGCLYAGAVAIPVHERLAPRLSAVVPDANALFALGISATHGEITGALETVGEGRNLQWLLTDEIVDDAALDWVHPRIEPETTAMVQYTSGSTAAPKGVMVSHRNLLHNLAAIREAWGGDDTAISVFWLPSHHDMGLIGANLSMLDIGCTTHLMSPTAFIKRPMRWLEAISRHRATYTVAPNFAYDACVRHSTPEERAALDLSSLTTVMNGAETVLAATLRAFAEAFAPAGFRAQAFMPVYGLAEATLLVSGGSNAALPLVEHVDRQALGEDRVVDAPAGSDSAMEVVGCGRVRGGQRLAIVDPVTRRHCDVDRIGEIWLAGPSVAQGFWRRPEQTEQTFSAFVAETSEGPFLRTGDLGFLRGGELFITGRCKDLIVIGGANYYPNDIEFVVQECHPALASGRGAAFAITPGLGTLERLVVVQELDRRIDAAELAELLPSIRAAISSHHAVAVHSVVLVDRSSIPTTSSGKVQRSLCRRQFLDGEIAPVAQWQVPSAPEDLAKARTLEAATAAADLIRTALAERQAAERGG